MLAPTPLARHECLWAISRKWVFVVRSLAAGVILGIFAVGCWLFWLFQTIESSAHSGVVIAGALVVAAGMNLTFVLFLAPAVMAGSFSSDPTRTALGILLITKVTAGEIVLSRFFSRICQIMLIAAAGLPGICFLAGYCNVKFDSLLALGASCLAVGCGAGSVALLFSILFTRARDALIGTYAVGLLLLFVPSILAGNVPPTLSNWIATLNPYLSLTPLFGFGDVLPAMRVTMTWVAVAVACNVLTTWLLWPSYLRRAAGTIHRSQRTRALPPVDENPIRWKELYVESNRDFGRVLGTIAKLTLVTMLGGSATLAVLFLWSELASTAPQLVEDILAVSSNWISILSLPMCWMMQWGVGIRAAAGISSEKEQGTWETLMMTPLEGREIVKAKIYVGLYSMRWFLIATLIVWLLGVMLESISPTEFGMLLLTTLFYVSLTSALGVWSSLNTKTPGQAIALTLLLWLGAKIAILIATYTLFAVSALVVLLFLSFLEALEGASGYANYTPPMALIPVYEYALCFGGVVFVAWYGGKHFDRLSGRGFKRRKPVLMERTRRTPVTGHR